MGKHYGKDKMFDGCPDTCWQSKEGKPQCITIEFDCTRSRTLVFVLGPACNCSAIYAHVLCMCSEGERWFNHMHC